MGIETKRATTTTIPIPIVINYQEEGSEWGVSFGGPNPEEKDYIAMQDRDAAFRLRDMLLGCARPIRSYTLEGELIFEGDRRSREAAESFEEYDAAERARRG